MEPLLKIKESINYYDYVFQNSIKSDVEIVVENKTLKAHKEVLGKQNPVFLDRLLSQPQLKKLEIFDLNPNAVENFIEYLYTGKISEGNLTTDLFLVAHRYMDSTLKDICREKLGRTLSLKNVTRRLLTFLECRENNLMEEASLFLAKNFNDVKSQLDFKKIFGKPEAVSAIFDAFDCCKITVLSEEKNPEKKALFDSAIKCDLTIKVQNEYFLAHKDILTTRNTVLKTVISALPLASEISSSINVPEFDSRIFKVFLTFLYTRNVDKKNISKELMCIAHKYVDERLEQICEDHLLPTLCEENAIEILELGTDVESEKLKEEASKFIADRFEVMKKQAAFKRMKENSLAVDAVFSRLTEKIAELYNDLNVIKNSETFHCEFSLKAPSNEGEITKSDRFFMKSCRWYISLHISAVENHGDLGWWLENWLGIFLYRDEKTESSKVKIKFSMTLVSNDDKIYDVLKEPATYSFSWNGGFGCKAFITVADLTDVRKGYLTNGNVTVKFDATFVE